VRGARGWREDGERMARGWWEGMGGDGRGREGVRGVRGVRGGMRSEEEEEGGDRKEGNRD